MSQHGDDTVDEGGAELALYIQNGEVLISGPTEAALAYVKQLSHVGAEVSAEVLSGRRAADVAAALATVGLAKQAVQGGVYLRVAEESMPHLLKNGLMPTKDGVHTFLGMTREGSHISHVVRFNGVAVSPAQMLTIQMIAIQIALRMAIGEILDSVKRVEGKVDALLRLAHADKAGNVLGLHQTLTTYSELLDESGVVTTSDWNAIASAGLNLEIVINQLRKHLSLSLAEVVVSAPIGHRAEALERLTGEQQIDQTLSLLVVVEDAMFKFQRLRVAHVQRTEPEFLEATVVSARQVLEDNSRMDEELYASAHATLNLAAVVRPLEIHRVMAASKLTKSAEQLRGYLDEFSRARRLENAAWHDTERPTMSDAAAELGRRVQKTGRAIDAVADDVMDKGFARLDSLGRTLQEVAQRRRAADSEAERDGNFAEGIEGDDVLQLDGKSE